jgi:hypothetical protein
MLFNFFKKKTKDTVNDLQLQLYKQQLELCKTQLEFNKTLLDFNREIYYHHSVYNTQQRHNIQLKEQSSENYNPNVTSIYTEDIIHNYIDNIELESDKTDDTIKEVLDKY